LVIPISKPGGIGATWLSSTLWDQLQRNSLTSKVRPMAMTSPTLCMAEPSAMEERKVGMGKCEISVSSLVPSTCGKKIDKWDHHHHWYDQYYIWSLLCPVTTSKVFSSQTIMDRIVQDSFQDGIPEKWSAKVIRPS
jgi:hypothetical protein